MFSPLQGNRGRVSHRIISERYGHHTNRVLYLSIEHSAVKRLP